MNNECSTRGHSSRTGASPLMPIDWANLKLQIARARESRGVRAPLPVDTFFSFSFLFSPGFFFSFRDDTRMDTSRVKHAARERTNTLLRDAPTFAR